MSYLVNFERATAHYDFSRTNAPLKLFVENKEAETITVQVTDGYIEELRYLVECIRNGRCPSIVTARDALEAVQICEAEERSARSGQRVTV
jgi:predicted dehydrogenase